jgi:hypothetical protein
MYGTLWKPRDKLIGILTLRIRNTDFLQGKIYLQLCAIQSCIYVLSTSVANHDLNSKKTGGRHL